MKVVIEIPDDTVEWAHAEGVNRQMITKFLREEVRGIGRRFGHVPELGRGQRPGESHEWRAWLFNHARVVLVHYQRKNPSRRAAGL
jgi:hypothetical protein